MEFEIKGVKYRTAKLDVFQQLKVSRKLLPVLAGLVSDFGTLKSMMVRDSEGKLVFGEKRAFDALDIVLPKIADTLAALPEEDVNAVIHPCPALLCASMKRVGENFRSGRADVRRYRPVHDAAAGGAGGRRQPGNF